MRLSERDFWALTPAQFMALAKRREISDEKDHFHAAIICSTIANVNRSKKQKAFSPQDFMPKKRKRKSWEEQLAYVKMLNVALGGKTKRR